MRLVALTRPFGATTAPLLISFENPLTLSEIILLSDDLNDRLSIRGSGLVVGREVATPGPEQEVERTPAI